MTIQSWYLPLKIWSCILTDDAARPGLILITKLNGIASQIDHLIVLQLGLNVLLSA